MIVFHDDASQSVSPMILCRFFQKHMDRDLQAMMESTVPPVQLDKLSSFKSSLFKYKKVGQHHGISYEFNDGSIGMLPCASRLVV